MKKKVLYVYENRIPIELRKLIIRIIKKHGFSCSSMNYKAPKIIQKKNFLSADAVFFAPGRHIDTEVLKNAKKAKIFQIWSSGYDKFNIEGAKAAKVITCNNGSQNGIAVAEHTVLLILACLKKLIHFYDRTVNGNWKNNSHGIDLYELRNKTIGILGFGKIGMRVAKILNGFEVNILYNDLKRLKSNDEKKLNIKYCTKNYLLKNSDIVTLHLHLNKNTKNIINSNSFKIMKKNSILVNVSRAHLINRSSLIKALRQKKISGFGIDAHYLEPTKRNDTLLKIENVISTPHIAGSTYDTYLRVINSCLENIKNAFNKPRNIKWRII